MFTKNRFALQGLLLVAAFSLLAGCSTSGKKPAGASARAEKGMMEMTDTGGTDPFGSDRPTGELIPLDQLAASQGVTNLCARIHFDYDKSEVKAEFRECLDNVAAFLSSNSSINVVIEGHCDERGTPEYNIALGEKRAVTAVDYLIAKGVSASRFTTRSWGEDKPLELGSNEAAWKQNRRADFYAVK